MSRLVLLALLAGSIAVAAAATVHHAAHSVKGIQSQKRFRFSSGRRVASGSGSGSVTDPPVEQPTHFIITFTSWCNQSMSLVPGSVNLFSGSWIVPPPAMIDSLYSGGEWLGFDVKHEDFGYVINGTAAYNDNQWPMPIDLGFAAVQGEWMFEASYWTPLQIDILTFDVGRITVYNLIIGRENMSPRC